MAIFHASLPRAYVLHFIFENVEGAVTRFRYSFRIQRVQLADAESARGATLGAGCRQPNTVIFAVSVTAQFQQLDLVAVPVAVALTLEEQFRRFEQLLQLRFAQSPHAFTRPATETPAYALAASSASSGAGQSAALANLVRGPGASVLVFIRAGFGTIPGGTSGRGSRGLQNTVNVFRYLDAAAIDQQSLPDLRRQNKRLSLRDFLVRVVQGILQAHRPEPQELCVP